jgi:hypothetical protein
MTADRDEACGRRGEIKQPITPRVAFAFNAREFSPDFVVR